LSFEAIIGFDVYLVGFYSDPMAYSELSTKPSCVFVGPTITPVITLGLTACHLSIIEEPLFL